MAKPTYSIGGLDYATLVKVNAFLDASSAGSATVAQQPQPQPGQAPVPPAPPAPPVAAVPPAPPTPPMPVAPTPPAPPAPPMPPTAPVAPVVAAPVAPAGGPTLQDVIKSMADAVARCGAQGAGKVAPLMAQYNAKTPGHPGPVTDVDPAQYGNLKAALDALTP